MIEDDIKEYNIEDSETTEGVEESEATEESGKKGSKSHKLKEPFLLLLKLLTRPVEGWKEVGRWHGDSDTMARRCFYPLLALAAATRFSTFLYPGVKPGLDEVLISAVGVFVSYFFGYFAVLFLSRMLLPRTLRPSVETEKGKMMVMMSMCTLVLFLILLELLPMLEPVLVFLPLYTVYIIMKGIRLLKASVGKSALRMSKQDDSRAALIMVVLIVCIPYLLQWCFDELLPLLAR